MSISLWSAPNLISTQSWRGVAFGNNTFVSSANDTSGSTIAYTPDPYNVPWTAVSTNPTYGWGSITFGNNMFVTVSSTSLINKSAISSDNGRTWTIKALVYSAATDQWFGVAFGNNVFVATTRTGTINTWDGNIANNWVKQTTSQPSSLNTYNFVNFVNGQFVMISSKTAGQQSTVYASTDGTSWTTKTSTLDGCDWISIAYGNGMYVAIATSKTSGGYQVAASTDLINWTFSYIGPGTYPLNAVVFANNTFVTLGLTNCFISSNGTTWTTNSNFSSSGVRICLCFGNNTFVSLCTGGAPRSMLASTVAPTLSNFTVPSGLTPQSPPFVLTAPTSNSTGAFTYTSSNTSVATISGSTVTVKGTGSSVITANQAATTTYTPGSIQSTLSVSSKTNPTLSNFSIPATSYGTSPFVITPPTSNSSGAFTYTSSNGDVATIVSVNQINIVGVGSSTITANQAETADYFAGSIDTVFEATQNAANNPVLVTDGTMLTYFMDTSATSAELVNSVTIGEPTLVNAVTSSSKVLTSANDGSLVTISYAVAPP